MLSRFIGSLVRNVASNDSPPLFSKSRIFRFAIKTKRGGRWSAKESKILMLNINALVYVWLKSLTTVSAAKQFGTTSNWISRVRHVKSIIIMTRREHRDAPRSCCAVRFLRNEVSGIKAVALCMYVSSDGIFAGIFDAEFSRSFPEFSCYALTCCSDDVACRAYFTNKHTSKVNLLNFFKIYFLGT